MKVLALERERAGVQDDDFRPHLSNEAMRAWQLYQAGVIREMYFREDRPCAVLILECPGISEAREALGTLPLVKQGLIDFELIPLVPYPGFARLFRDQQTKE
ncbi:MAG: superoxide dismutase [Bacillota bacterium]